MQHARVFSRPLRVLVVDDEPGILRAVRRVLDGHELVEVENVDAALEVLASEAAFDVVLCDVRMPGRSGLDLHVHAMRYEPELARRFVLITGGVLSPEQQAHVDEHDVTCLRKPFSPQALRDAIAAASAGSSHG